MNTALITVYDSENAVLTKQRTMDDHDAIWSAVVVFLAEQDTASVKVERFDPQDDLVQSYTVALVA